MTRTRAAALFLALAGGGALAVLPGRAAEAPAARVHLTSISSRPHASGAALVIVATEPVPYATTRPDPFTVLLDFRNVGTEGLANLGAVNLPPPIADVAVEPIQNGGTPSSRVRVSLAEPVAHRVRSERNTVVVEFAGPIDAMADGSQPPAQTVTQGIDPIAALGLGPQTASEVNALAQAQPAVPVPAQSSAAPAAAQPATQPGPDPSPATRSSRSY